MGLREVLPKEVGKGAFGGVWMGLCWKDGPFES